MKPFENLSNQGQALLSSASKGATRFIIGDFGREVKKFLVRYIRGIGDD
jgi:hypothetical protein